MKARTLFATLLSLLSLAAASCESDSTSEPTVDAGSVTGFDAGEEADASTVSACTPSTKGPTKHDANITNDETWAAEGSPHVVSGGVRVLDGATLTIEPCAEVWLEEDAVLGVRKGTFSAEGTATKPIRFTGKDGAAWTKLEFDAPGIARLAYVTIEGGGGAGVNDQDDTSVDVWGDDTFPADPVLYVDHVTIKGSGGVGIAMHSMATFVEGSHDLVITGSGGDAWPYAMSLEEHSIDSLPTGSYTGNKKDEIYLRLRGAGTAGDGLKVDATLHDRGVPYRLDGKFNVAVNEDGDRLATLTIEAGVTVKFPKGKFFEIEHWTGDAPATGAIRALGTAERPIVLTSAEASPAPGDWGGLWFGNVPSAQNKLDHVIIEYAGAGCGCSSSSCSDINTYNGAVIITNRPAGGTSPFITNSTIRHIAGHGIQEGWRADGDTSIDFQPTNVFEDVSGCAQTHPLDNQGCPKPKPACW